MSDRVRPPAVAGFFYPDDPATLAQQVDSMLALTADPDRPAPKALIAPHAGYRYSGEVAASAYRLVEPARHTIERVVLLGPAHRVAVRALGTTSADAWRTPLGEIPIDQAGRDLVLTHPAVQLADAALAPEHSLEVHLPFLQRVLDDGWTLLPLIVGRAEPAIIADVLDLVWGGAETLIVVSTDLSHFHDHDTAVRLDRATVAAIAAGSLEIGPRDACGAYPVRGLLAAAARRSVTVDLLDRRTSGDTQGDRSRVVGYASFALSESVR